MTELIVNLFDGDFAASWQITEDDTGESVSIDGHTQGLYTVSERCPNCSDGQYCCTAHEFDGGVILIDEDLSPQEYLNRYGFYFVVPDSSGSNLI